MRLVRAAAAARQDGGSGGYEFAAVVFAYAENVDSYLIGELDLLEKIAYALGGCKGNAAGLVRGCFNEAIDTDLHFYVPPDIIYVNCIDVNTL